MGRELGREREGGGGGSLPLTRTVHSLSASVKNNFGKSGGPLKDMVIYLGMHEKEEGVHLLPIVRSRARVATNLLAPLLFPYCNRVFARHTDVSHPHTAL
jgi:hypothetical protein